LANSVGIIDSGYRGELIGAFRSLSKTDYTIDKYNRLLQITNAFLTPIIVRLVDESELSSTERGSGGFGSTGV
jgi:dUTP pyrophosphatase